MAIGNTLVSWIGGQVGWSTYSDARVKEEVAEDVHGLDFILNLRPVTYRYNIEQEQRLMTGQVDTNEWEGKYDIEQIRFSGFIAQEVEQAAEKAGYDFSGLQKPVNEHTLYTLRYAEFVVPLVKAVQEQQAIIECQRETIARQQAMLDELRQENTTQDWQLSSQDERIRALEAEMARITGGQASR